MKKVLGRIILVITIIYALLGAYFMLSLPIGSGDEQLFISDLNFITENGWIKAIEKGISLPHALMVYPINSLLSSHIALRFASILSLIVLYLYLFYRNKPSIWFFIYFTFFIGTAKVFFIGTNDSLFILSLVVFFNEVYRTSIGKECNVSLAFSALIISVFTRELIVVYLPIIGLGLFLVFKAKQFKLKQFVVPALVLIFCVVINIPAFKLNGKPTYDAKKPPENVTVNWTQRQYLAQLLVNEGKLPNHQHPSFIQTQKYIDKNGEDALPKSLLQSLLFNPTMTLKEFFKDFYSIIYYGTRQLGLILLIVLGFSLLKIKKLTFLKPDSFIPISLLALTVIFALLIIAYVELRWLVPMFIMAIIYYAHQEKIKKLSKSIVIANMAFTLVLIAYGVYKLVPEL